MHNVFKVPLGGRYLHIIKYILSIWHSNFHIILLLHLSVLRPQACKCFLDGSGHFKVDTLMSITSPKNVESFWVTLKFTISLININPCMSHTSLNWSSPITSFWEKKRQIKTYIVNNHGKGASTFLEESFLFIVTVIS